MQERGRQAENKVSFETARNGNSATYLARLLEFQEQLTDEWAGRTFTAYCEAWVEQNRQVSPPFIRAVRDRRIRQVFAARTQAVEAEITNRATRISEPINPFVLRNWRMRMDRLANRWHHRLEAEAAKCEYNVARNIPYDILGFGRPQLEVPAIRDTQRDVGRLPAQRTGRSDVSKRGRRSKLPQDFVRLAGQLYLDARKSGNSRISDRQLGEIAKELDAVGFRPPARFLEGDFARLLKTFNSHHSNSKAGPIETWVKLVAHGDKDHLRGMRRLLYRCAEKFASPGGLSGN
jgi:hypothetical protein